MNKFIKVAAALLSTALMAGSLAACDAKTPGESGGTAPEAKDDWTYQYGTPTAEGLLSEGEKQNRYMTLPNSRVVVNPFNFESQAREVTASRYSNRSTMPLNFGFCDPFKGESRGVELPNVVMMAEKGTQGGGVETVWEANLQSSATWNFSGTAGVDYNASFHGDSVSLSVAQGAPIAWQHMESLVRLDIDNTYLSVTVEGMTHAAGRFAIKVTDGQGGDITLTETNTPGTYTFNLKEATKWSGEKAIRVKLFAITQGNEVTFSNVRIQKGAKSYADAGSYSTSWRPDYLGFEASYPRGTNISGKDFFYDEKTVVRVMDVSGGNGFLLYGEYNGRATVADGTVLVDCGNFKYAVTVSVDIQPRFYSSVVEALAGGEGMDSPGDSQFGVWAYPVETIPEDGQLRVAVSFDTKEAADADVAAMSQKPGGDCGEKLAARTAQWDALLAKVPRPGTFELDGIDAKGVSGGDVEQSYYEAWVQIIGNVLPPNPEVDYAYPSFAAGKASLWGYGSPKCSYAATWESLYGMSYYVQIDPDAAWEMYKGLMSLVDESGQIAGESLPSNNARVAWILYTVKPDKEALAQVQPQLEQHLTWRFNNPRWIYMDNTPDTFQKDMDFVSSALIDVRYLMRINEELGLESENSKWDIRIGQLYSNMKMWFFSPVTEYPVQYFSLAGNKRSEGNALWVTKGLYIPDVEESEISEMVRLFRHIYKPDRPFCGLGGIKYEPYNYTLIGLMQHGYAEEARTMSQTAVRDVVLSGVHAEGYCYAGTETSPLPEGVRPSMFGAAMLIDNVYMMNGVRMDDGMPVFSNYFAHDGGLENYKVEGKTFHFRKAGNEYTYGGSFVGGEKTLEVESDKVGIPFEGTNVHPFH